MNALKKLSPIVLMFMLLFSMIAAIPSSGFAAETVPGCKQWHTVRAGEYLIKIGTLYNTDWKTISTLNNLTNPNLIYVGQVLCVSTTQVITTLVTPLPPSASGIRIYALSAQEDKTVTLQGKTLSINSNYTIYMSNARAKLATEYWAGTVTTDKSGAFTVTINLPKRLIDVTKINVKIINSSKDTAFNWFYNITSTGNVGGIGSPNLGISIVSVVKEATVKIQTSNLPASVPFQVYMDVAGSKGEKGILVGTLLDTKGGTVTATFNIPTELADHSKIDIRLESIPLEMYTYQTFENK